LTLDLRPERIESALELIDPVFRGTPQFVDQQLSAALGREVVIKVETLNPIGSFKARGASVLVRDLDPARTWVCSTAGNFGQALAYLARRCTRAWMCSRRRRSRRTRSLACERSARRSRSTSIRGSRARSCSRQRRACARRRRTRSRDGRGAGTIGIELPRRDLDAVVVQVGDGALISGVACWLKRVAPRTRIVAVCASGAPAMAHSFTAGRAVRVEGEGTIATALAITEPVPESVARVTALVDEIVLVDDDDLRRAMALISESVGVLVEPAGAAESPLFSGTIANLRVGGSR
jgi:threonine dehydratase